MKTACVNFSSVADLRMMLSFGAELPSITAGHLWFLTLNGGARWEVRETELASRASTLNCAELGSDLQQYEDANARRRLAAPAPTGCLDHRFRVSHFGRLTVGTVRPGIGRHGHRQDDGRRRRECVDEFSFDVGLGLAVSGITLGSQVGALQQQDIDVSTRRRNNSSNIAALRPCPCRSAE